VAATVVKEAVMRWSTRRSLLGSLASTVVVALIPAGSAAAGPATTRPATRAQLQAAQPATPRFDVRAAPTASDRLADISCVSSSFCVAVGGYADLLGGSHSLAEEWNGDAWRVLPGALGAGLSSVSCTKTTFCVAVGSVAQAWNGHAWHALANSGSFLTSVSCTSASFCMGVAGGSSGEANVAESWNGSRWRVLKTPVEGCVPFCGLSGVACTSAKACVAVGSTGNDAGTEDFSEGMAWNGRAWRKAPTPAPGGSSSLSGVSCASAHYCVAVGAWEQDSPPCNCVLAAAWNGSTWTQLPTPSTGTSMSGVSCPAVGKCVGLGGDVALEWSAGTPAPLTVAQPGTTSLSAISCSRPTTCLAVGSYGTIDNAHLTLAEQWTGGSTWLARRTPSPDDAFSGLSGVSCTSATSCVAVGDFINGTDRQVTLAERWNGRGWRVLTTSSPGPHVNVLDAVSCPRANRCMAVGYYDSAGQHQAFAEQWNGTSWQVQSVPQPGSLTAVSCVTASDCVAVGSYLSASKRLGLTATWNGAAWTVQPSPTPGGSLTEFNGVSCPSASDCIAVGEYNTGVATPLLPLSARWNGVSWTALKTPAPGGADGLAAVSCLSPSSCMAVGSYFHRHGRDFPIRTLAESWNGHSWRVRATSLISGSLRPHLAAVSCPVTIRGQARCMAVGGYLSAAGLGFVLAESWNGTSWSRSPIPSPGPAFNDLYGLACPAASRCVAVGEVGVQRASSYLWNGSHWSPLPTRSP
jgi:hypothetical protein